MVAYARSRGTLFSMRHMYPLSHRGKALYALTWVAALVLVSVALALFVLFLAAPAIDDLSRMGWAIFAFVSGIMFLSRPAVFPLLYVLRSLSAGKRPARAPVALLFFAFGTAISLSLYGMVAGMLGAGISFMYPDVLDAASSWAYLFSGVALYIYALSEMGLMRFFGGEYLGRAPKFVERASFSLKTFLLGGFFGNVGIGAAHPALLVLLVASIVSSDPIFGVSLFLLHALGRMSVPAALVLAEYFGGSWLGTAMRMKRALDRTFAAATLLLASFIVTFALFSSGWWVKSGLPETFRPALSPLAGITLDRALADPTIVSAPTLFGQPREWGNAFLVLLLSVPLILHYFRERRRVLGDPELQLRRIERLIDLLEEERRGIEAILHITDGVHGARYREIERKIEALEKERRIIESSRQYGIGEHLCSPELEQYEKEILRLRRNWYLAAIAVLAALLLVK